MKTKAQSVALMTGDILSASEALYVEQLQKLWDMLSDCVEGGRLTEADLPDDYRALISQMVKLANLDGKIWDENNNDE